MTSLSRRGLLAGVATATALATLGTTGQASAASALPPLDPAALRAAIGDLRHPPAVAAQLRVSGAAGRWYGASGVSDTATGRPVGPNDKVRAGSVTKPFVAVVVLQLAREGRVALDAPVRRYLPELLPGTGAFRRITVAQLLDHTSGMPDHIGLAPDGTPEDVLRHRFDSWTPPQVVATATKRPPKFEPGTKQEYRGVNYILAALVAERVTRRPYGAEVRDRVLRPLGLGHTDLPSLSGHDTGIHGPHLHGYLDMTDGRREDITAYDMSSSWAEGELVTTTGDLTRFLAGLFSGALLQGPWLERMFTLPPDGVRMLDGSPARYSTGLQTATVNGVTLWGKTGEQYGYGTGAFSTRDQHRRLVWTFTPTGLDADRGKMSQRVVEAATAR
ncbi:serine hydrolase domain-containing protein [Streptomyces sp. NPDC048172]|uniref:serine hydrolase domain-containing protein n=1 Tax=Streptomyces sp. NPDC048172 TaxID=3365505 RepID=UPI003718EFF8